jgi:branched-chain amino acid transport system permease protein
MDAGLLAQYIMNGLMLGMMYALVAVGFTLFFGVLDIIKFSHGDVLTVGAFTALATYVGLRSAGIGSSPVILLIILRGGLCHGHVGLADRTRAGPAAAIGAGAQYAVDHADARHSAAGIGAAVLSAGANPKPFPALLPSVSVNFGNFNLRLDNALMLAAGMLVIVGLQTLLNRTKLGLAIRAVAQDEETARTMGINFTAIVLITFAIGSGLAAFAGIMNGLYYNEINFGMGLYLRRHRLCRGHHRRARQHLWRHPRRLSCSRPATIGAVALPFASAYKDVFAFTVVIIFMAWRPTGLIQEKISERV